MKLMPIVFLFFALGVSGASATPILEKVDTHFVGQTFIAELLFNNQVEAKNILVEYINQTIQVNIPNATVKNGKSLKKINQNQVKSLYTYQFDPTTMRARIIHEKSTDANRYKGMVSVDSDGARLIITVNDPSAVVTSESKRKDMPLLPPINIEKQMNMPNQVQSSEVAEDIVEKELGIPTTLPEKIAKLETGPKTKVGLVNSVVAEKPQVTDDSMDSKELKMESKKEEDLPVFKGKNDVTLAKSSSFSRMIYSLLVILIFAGGLMVFIKWYSKNHKSKLPNTKIQVLTQHHLGPKKNLVIVRVAGESLLLGVTDNNISMLKTLSFIDDEFMDDVPTSFVSEMQTKSKQSNLDKVPKVTYNPEGNTLDDIESQVKNKLNTMRYI